MKDEFEKFCERYISTAEDEWEKTDNPVDLSAATVAKIMLNKYRELRASAVEVEPLAELAHKKGFSSISFQRDWECEPLGIKDGIWHYSLYMHQSHLGRKPLSKGFSTYAECEAKARSYLNGLTDAAGKGDN